MLERWLLHTPRRNAYEIVVARAAFSLGLSIATGVHSQAWPAQVDALAIMSAQALFSLPDVPTLDDLGVKGVTVYSWQAFAAPRVPADIQQKLHGAIVAGLNAPGVKPKLLDSGSRTSAIRPWSSALSRPQNSRAGNS